MGRNEFRKSHYHTQSFWDPFKPRLDSDEEIIEEEEKSNAFSKKRKSLDDRRSHSYLPECQICNNLIGMHENLICYEWGEIFCKAWITQWVESKGSCSNCRKNINKDKLVQDRYYRKLVEDLKKIEEAKVCCKKHNINSDMYCEDCEVLVWYKWIVDKSHNGHEIIDFHEGFKKAKTKISEITKDVKELRKFLHSQEKIFKTDINPAVVALEKFRDDMLNTLRAKFDAYIQRYADSEREISSRLGEISKTLIVVSDQEAVLVKMKDYSPKEDTYNEMTKLLTSFKEEKKGKLDNMFCNYLDLPKDKQEKARDELVKLSADTEKVLSKTWCPNEALIQEITETVKKYCKRQKKEYEKNSKVEYLKSARDDRHEERKTPSSKIKKPSIIKAFW